MFPHHQPEDSKTKSNTRQFRILLFVIAHLGTKLQREKRGITSRRVVYHGASICAARGSASCALWSYRRACAIGVRHRKSVVVS